MEANRVLLDRGFILIGCLLLLFSISIQADLTFLREVLGVLLFFYIPGFVLFRLIKPASDLVETIVYSFAFSVVLTISFMWWLNLICPINVSLLIVLAWFEVLFPLFLLKLYQFFQRRENFSPPSKDKQKIKINYWLILTLVVSIIIRTYLLLQVKTIIGADVGRFTIISHSLFLKNKIALDLRPYDDARGFAYFPGAFTIPLLLELLGFDPIFGTTIFLFLVDFFSLLAYYLFIREVFHGNVATLSLFFYSFFFDPLLNMGVFGVFPNALSIFFLILLFHSFYQTFSNEEVNPLTYSILLVGMFSFHIYPALTLLVYLLAILTSAITEGKFTKMLRSLTLVCAKMLPLAFLLVFPVVTLMYNYFGISFQKDNVADILMFSRWKIANLERVTEALFSTPVGLRVTPLSIAGFIFFLFAAPSLVKKGKLFIVLYTFYSTFLSYLLVINFNLARSVFGMWFIYSISLALFLKNWKVNFLLLVPFLFIESQSPLFLMLHLRPIENPQVPWVVWDSFFETMAWIKNNVPLNATFLIDGGGAGCTGANPSYGERIFPLTSRKIFYFTDYCWADYDKKLYEHKVDIYRRISINPDDKEALEELKKFGVTHVYIGKYWVGLNPKLFMKSKNYHLIYKDGENYIFEIKEE